MMLSSYEKRAARRALARGALAVLLTLYVCNIYPKQCFGVDVEVENIFDFSVPVGVVATGVVEGFIGQLDEVYFENIITNMHVSLTNYYHDKYFDQDWLSVAPYYRGYNTNPYAYRVGTPYTNLSFNSFGSQYSDGALNAATHPDTNILYSSSGIIPWLSVPDINSTVDLLSQDLAGPFHTYLDQADVILTGLAPSSQFFLENISELELASFDGGLIDSYISTISDSSILAWLPPAWAELKVKLASLLSDNRYSVRIFVGPVSCLLYVFLCFRWWLRRIFYVFEVFTGASSGRSEPLSNDSQMKG